MDILYLLIPLSAVLVLAILGIFGWVFEPSTDPSAGHHHDDDYPTDDRPDAVDGSEDAPTDAEAGDGEVDGSSDDADERTLEPAMASTEETTVG